MILLYTRFIDVMIIGLGVEFWGGGVLGEEEGMYSVQRQEACCAAWVREKNRAVERG